MNHPMYLLRQGMLASPSMPQTSCNPVMRFSCIIGTVVMLVLAVPAGADICGCETSPSLGAFDSGDPATYPPSTEISDHVLSLPLSADGVLVFDSFTVDDGPGTHTSAVVRFIRNAANSPVQLRIKGDLFIGSGSSINVSGDAAIRRDNNINGIGGLGGPGGFRGGDGAYQLVNFAADGATGLGPGGGLGATVVPEAEAEPASFVGTPELLPLVGGAGGGGGRSTTNELGCAGGGGGGGGGAIFIAVNGDAIIDGEIVADGGDGNSYWTFRCSSSGSHGSGGAIRIAAEGLGGGGKLYARGDSSSNNDGGIRLEAYSNSLSDDATDPVASRAQAPGPLLGPLSASVAITTVNGEMLSRESGEPLATLPQGGYGLIDVVLSAPGAVDLELLSSGVPINTEIAVSLKASPNGRSELLTALIDPGNCNADGDCTIAVSVPDVVAGRYVIEAQATFQTP
jgi:hypothetical protein